MYDFSVLIGRFQPIHTGHVQLIRSALKKSKKIIIGIGSANAGRSPRNPFTFEERRELIMAEFRHDQSFGTGENDILSRMLFVPIDDMLYMDTEWANQVRYRFKSVMHGVDVKNDDPSVGLFGYEKDSTSYYLKFFPEWNNEVLKKEVVPYNSTEIREFFYKHALIPGYGMIAPDMVYGDQIGITSNSGLFTNHDLQQVLYDLAAEWEFNKNYDPSKFPINVLTVDAVVVCNSHVLLVRRKYKPGKGNLALPGGHLDPGEKLERSMLRELREETRIDLSDRVLRSNIVRSEIFDHPQRSERARVITNAYLINLQNEDVLPKVIGSDDANVAIWVPLSEIRKADLFEDHFDIIERMTSNL